MVGRRKKFEIEGEEEVRMQGVTGGGSSFHMHIEPMVAPKDQGRNCRRVVPFSTPMMQAADHFDRLPDSLLLLIFNKLADIKALGRCCAVSKRFHSLTPLVDNVVVKVDCVISGEDSGLNARGGRGNNQPLREVCGRNASETLASSPAIVGAEEDYSRGSFPSFPRGGPEELQGDTELEDRIAGRRTGDRGRCVT